ncbi:MAG: phosphotransferase, partial [Candidatus Omnitrophica bacterium]|nr:phosphotransferase [Candidatus Omnitrophota bacterium]
AYQRASQAGLKIIGLSAGKSFWADAGTPFEYVSLHGQVADAPIRWHKLLRKAQLEQSRRRAALERQGVWCSGAIGLGRGVKVAAGTQLHNIVIWDRCRINQPFYYSEGVFSHSLSVNKTPLARRKPDQRIFEYLRARESESQLFLLREQGSGRRYFRLTLSGKSWVWCVYNRQRRENGTYACLCRFLENLGLNVPQVYLHLVDAGEILMADLGDVCLQGITDQSQTEQCLREVIHQVAYLHVQGTLEARMQEVPLQSPFTKGLYDWERDYFQQYILAKLIRCPEIWAEVAEEYSGWRKVLLTQPAVLLHRDLQSANIMVFKDKPYLIDFQGMRLGCAGYDVAALLFDPYRCYPWPVRERLWYDYCQQVINLGGAPVPERVFYLAACQRLLQALGAFGKLWLADGLFWYRQFILPGIQLLQEAARNSKLQGLVDLAGKVGEKAETILKNT